MYGVPHVVERLSLPGRIPTPWRPPNPWDNVTVTLLTLPLAFSSHASCSSTPAAGRSGLDACSQRGPVLLRPAPGWTCAGNVSPYSFVLPPTWIQQRIANILSGNYCQPKCAEPWIEVKFEDPKQGVLQVQPTPCRASPLCPSWPHLHVSGHFKCSLVLAVSVRRSIHGRPGHPACLWLLPVSKSAPNAGC